MSSFKMSSAKGGRYVSTSTSIEAETNRRHFTSGIFKRISLNEIIRILIKCHWTLFRRVGLTKSRRWLHSVSMSTWLQAMIKANNALFDWRIYGHSALHDDVIKWKHFPSYWPSVWGGHRSPVNSSHKDQWHGVWWFFFDLRLNKLLIKQSWGWWFGTPSRPLWRHCNGWIYDCKRRSLTYHVLILTLLIV